MSKSYISCNTEIEIPFHDVDMMEVAWHGHYARYLEIARSQLLEKFDYNYPQMKASGYAWPVIELNIRYAQPLRFQQRINIQSDVIEIENRLKISYIIYDAVSAQRLTRAYTVQVAIQMTSGEMQFASPNILLEKLGLKTS